MARILAGRDIRRLIGTALMDADEQLINPNGIELRLGKHALFHSTGEDGELEAGKFLQVQRPRTPEGRKGNYILDSPTVLGNHLPKTTGESGIWTTK